ncbi:RNA polymerase subunit sigma-24 [Chitinophaga alhagiae]|uniref:RNA polymerase sigma factor n=1 Tax=Chitinophaga alhagiae TaxID=2203219 RepID=A0ABN5LLT8_9BACT|nr:sigma-70 family RNA polymerase sigma factor [Chitinophaga alhagiae]AWO00292.1 RNA polymerase subunit sigma-24 [Chitinophaga alhagiae]
MVATKYLSEQALLADVASGNSSAFRALYEHWYPFLDTHIFRITTSKPLTQEIVQDVFLKIWEARETLHNIRSFKAYLLVVSKNHALNALQKLAAEHRNQERWAREQPPVQDAPPFYYSLIDEAIDRLTDRQKEVYLLHRHQRLTYKEIAGRLGIGRETVKYHLEVATAAISRYVQHRLAMMAALILLLQ